METAWQVMLVDDNRESLESISDALWLNGYRNQSFIDPLLAVEAYSSQRYDVVISDYQMAGLNGLQLLQAIKQKNPQAVTILLSGVLDISKMQKQPECIFLRKPLHLETLLEILERIKKNTLMQAPKPL